MTWTAVYDSVIGAEVVNYDWKPNHEYQIFMMAAHRERELDNCRILTLDGSLSPANKGYANVGVDSWITMVQSPTKHFRSVAYRGARCPIVKILERPLTVGATHATDNENWEQFWTGSVGTGNTLNLAWEYGYEYCVYTRKSMNLGPYSGNPSWVSMGHFFAAPAMINAIQGSGEAYTGAVFHPTAFDGWVQFYKTSQTGNPPRFHVEGTSGAICFCIYRRPLRILTEADAGYNGWKVTRTALPNGIQIGRGRGDAKPLAWSDDAEVVINHTDPSGEVELSSAYFYTDAALINNPALLTQWNWQLIGQQSGSSCQAALCPPKFENKGYKTVFAWGSSSPRLMQAYEKLPRVNPPTPLPPPDPPPVEACEDRCYLAGAVWEQTATMEVKFLNPPDWQSRQYEYEWGGDLGNGQIELVETLEGGRIAKIRLSKELAITDADGEITFDVTCLVSDVQYSTLGITDLAEAQITFELPCVFEGNDPDISVEDMTIVEQDANRVIQVRVYLSEPYIGDQLCMDWTTVDGTATSDLAVQALARDTGQLPFITVIESSINNTRIYIDGAFPKWYNMNYTQAMANPVPSNLHYKTLIFSKNLMNWLKGSRTSNKVLLMGNREDTGNYNVKLTASENAGSFRDYWTTAASELSKTLDVLYASEVAAQPDVEAFLDQYECVIFFSTLESAVPTMPPSVITAMINLSRQGLGIACIADHGDNQGNSGYFKGANEFLEPAFNVKMKGSVNRQGMVLNVEGFKPHPLWTGITGQFPSNDSEAYVDATDTVPDYVAGSGQICFANGESEKFIPIEIIGDTIEENQFEQFSVVVSNNNRGVLVKPIGVITIEDDDAEPCGVATPSGGNGVTETAHALGSNSGVVTVSYNMFSQPDQMDIFYEGNLVATTGGFVSGSGTLSFYYAGPPRAGTCMIRMTGSGEGTAWNYTLNCPVPVPEASAYIYATSAEANAKMAVFTPPTPQDVFNSWDRFDGGNYFVGGVGATGDAAAWQLLNNPTRVNQPNNASFLTGFVSPTKFSDYIFEAVLTSADNDDDLIGLLVGAHVPSAGTVKTLSFARTGGGIPGPASSQAWNWGVFLSTNNSGQAGTPSMLVGSNGGWGGRKSKVRIERNGNIITARCTDFYTGATAPAYLASSEIEIDLMSDPMYAEFRNESNYGYVTRSQAGATYLDVLFTGGLNESKVYDVQLNATYEYNFGTNSWQNLNKTIQQDLGSPIFVTNPETNQRFFVDNNNIESA